jgi:aspartyl/asparaginyl beta-hydroxylase (cupin superfamily)
MKNSEKNNMASRVAIHNLGDFPKLDELADHWQVIKKEYLAVKQPTLDVSRSKFFSHKEVVDHMESSNQYGWLTGWSVKGGEDPNWLSLMLMLEDKPCKDAEFAYPNIIRLLKGVKGIKVAALNKLMPHSMISAHNHAELIEERLLQYHCCLYAPEENSFNYLNVDGVFIQQKEGLSYVFDGAHQHFALNESKDERVILYVEFYEDYLRHKK